MIAKQATLFGAASITFTNGCDAGTTFEVVKATQRTATTVDVTYKPFDRPIEEGLPNALYGDSRFPLAPEFVSVSHVHTVTIRQENPSMKWGVA